MQVVIAFKIIVFSDLCLLFLTVIVTDFVIFSGISCHIKLKQWSEIMSLKWDVYGFRVLCGILPRESDFSVAGSMWLVYHRGSPFVWLWGACVEGRESQSVLMSAGMDHCAGGADPGAIAHWDNVPSPQPPAGIPRSGWSSSPQASPTLGEAAVTSLWPLVKGAGLLSSGCWWRHGDTCKEEGQMGSDVEGMGQLVSLSCLLVVYVYVLRETGALR